MWGRRDWSGLALRRASRWQSRGTAPRPASIGRTVRQPTLRLFGAGAHPGLSMATALPRSLPLVLRLKPPVRPVGPPMLTVQSSLPAEAGPSAQLPAFSGVTASQTETQGVAPVPEPPRVQEKPSLVSQALRILRRQAPPAETEQPQPSPAVATGVTPDEAAPAEPARSSVETPTPAPVATRRAAPARPETPRVLRHTTEAPAEATSELPGIARQPEALDAPQRQIASAPEVIEAEQPTVAAERPTPPMPNSQRAAGPRRSGLLYTVRRVLQREPTSAALEPATPQAASSASSQAPSPLASERQATPRETPSTEPAAQEAGPQRHETAQAPAYAETPPRGETNPQPARRSGPLLTLRRLFRPDPEPPVERRSELGQAFTSDSREPVVQPHTLREDRLPGELLLTPGTPAPATPVMRSETTETVWALARPRAVQTAGSAATSAATAATLQETATTQTSPTANSPSTVVAEPVGRSASVPTVDRSDAAGTRTRAAPRSMVSPPATSLVYLARKPSAAAGRVPEGMTTFEVPQEDLRSLGIAAAGDPDRGGDVRTIARAVSVSDVAAARGATDAANGDETNGEASRGEVNLETLARRVYDRIRNRLRIERERSGLSSGIVGR